MTGMLGRVVQTERAVVEGVPVVEVQVNLGGDEGDEDLLTTSMLAPPGDDSLPLPGDEVVVEESEGAGATTAVGFADPKNPGVAEPGEKRQFARDDEGTLVCEVWLKKDGTIALKSIASGSKIDINGVLVDQQGNMIVPGEVTVMAVDAQNPAPTAIKVSTHLHGSGTGPTTGPTPGT